MSSGLNSATNPADVGSPIVFEDCTVCVLTDAVSCPACNATGTLVFRAADLANEPTPGGPVFR